MNIDEIELILEKNPDISFEDARQQAIRSGIPPLEFDEAWKEMIARERKRVRNVRTSFYFSVFLFAVALLGFDIGVWQYFFRQVDPFFSDIMGAVGLFSSNVLTLHLAARLAGGSGNIFRTLKVAFFLFILALAVQTIDQVNELLYAVYVFGGVIVGIMVFAMMMKTYRIGFVRTFIMLLIQGIFMMGIITITYGPDFIYQLFLNA